MDALKPFLTLAEKALTTYVEAFIGLLVLGQTIGASTAQAAAIAAIPAAITVVANGLPIVSVGMPFYVDLGFRTARTYVAAFLGYLVGLPYFSVDVSVFVAAAASALPTALAVLKGGLLGRNVGDRTTAAVLPASADLASAA